MAAATFGAAAAGVVSPADAQRLLALAPGEGQIRIVGTDRAVLSSDRSRDDFPCRVEPLDPKLDYDLNFRAGYNIRVPLAALAGKGDRLRVLFRVTPLEGNGEPVYFRDTFHVPEIEEGIEGETTLTGRYRLGPGRYSINWLMRDRRERVCSKSWETNAKVIEDVEGLAASPTPNTVSSDIEDLFFDEPPVMRKREASERHVKILLNFTPLDRGKPGLSEYDQRSVLAMLRAFYREPGIGYFTLVAFSMEEERVFFEQTETTRIDFEGLGEAVGKLRSGMVDFAKLQDKESGLRFLEELFAEHLSRTEKTPAAVVILGPKLALDKNPSNSLLPPSRRIEAPIFHIIHNRNPRAYPWKDAISAGLRGFRSQDLEVARPIDFGRVMRRVLERISAAPTS